MALSNIAQEPRREITESAVGISVVVGGLAAYMWADYLFAFWMRAKFGDYQMPLPVGMFVGFIGGIIVFVLGALFLIATHALGEKICNALDDFGWRLRPKVRYPAGRNKGLRVSVGAQRSPFLVDKELD